MSYTLPNSSLLDPVVGDSEIGNFLTVEADLRAMLDFEAGLAATQADFGLVPASSAEKIAAAVPAFTFQPETIAASIARDGLAVPALVSLLRERLPETVRPHLHMGATSQDVIDTSLMIRMKAAFNLLAGRLEVIARLVDQLVEKFGTRQLMGRTRMQRALPVLVADRLRTWRILLEEALDRVTGQEFPVQLGGAAGTLSYPGADMAELRAGLAARLGLSSRGVWHSIRTPVIQTGEACCAVCGALGKIGADVSVMAQNEIAEIRLSGTGSSSAMAHKQNPVKAETLVALARFNAVQLSALHQGMVHETERSGAAWTLEWLVLPQMVVTAGAATRVAIELLKSVEELGG